MERFLSRNRLKSFLANSLNFKFVLPTWDVAIVKGHKCLVACPVHQGLSNKNNWFGLGSQFLYLTKMKGRNRLCLWFSGQKKNCPPHDAPLIFTLKISRVAPPRGTC